MSDINEMNAGMRWYVAHTYSGYENAVKAAIEKFVANRNLQDMILRIEIPMEKVTEVTEAGVMKEVERKVFPGYVLIKMVMTDDTWHLIRNIRGVTGFVGSANKAIPLTEDEVLALGMEKHEIVVLYHVGDTVRITDGPLASFNGVVEDIEPEKNKVRVVVRFKGREMAHQDLGRDVLARFEAAMAPADVVEKKPVLDGRIMSMVVVPAKN